MLPDSFQVYPRGDREIFITRAFAAPRELVFQAFTTPEYVQQWLLGPEGWSMPVCEIDLRVGGDFRYLWRKDDGTEMGLRGQFQEIAQPERIVHTEIFDQDWTEGETRVTTTFAEDNNVTTVTIVVLYSSTQARDGAARSGMDQGLTVGYDRLEKLLGTLQQQ